MSTVVSFANNQVMVTSDANGAVTITTDPIAMGSMDRVSLETNIHNMFGGTTQQLRVTPQYSNDGTSWVSGTNIDYASAAATPAFGAAQSVLAAFLRIAFVFQITSGSGTGAVHFDCIGKIDKV